MGDWKFEAISSSIKECQARFVGYLGEDCGTLVEWYDTDPAYLQIPNWVRNRLADRRRMLNFQTLHDPSKELSEMQILEDFSTKMVEKEVTGCQDYYQKAQEVSKAISARVAKYIRPLRAIEDCERAKKLELPALPTMLETLNEYISKHEIPKLQGLEELTALIGGPGIQNYAACHAIAEVMLLRQKDKQRCVIFHGAVDSGKTWIAKIMNRIFISYSKR